MDFSHASNERIVPLVRRYPRNVGLKVIAAILLFSNTGCVATSQADRASIQKAFRDQRPQIDHAALLSSASYDASCPRPGRPGIRIDCFIVPIPNRPEGYVGSYLIETDEAAKEQTIAFRGTYNLSDGWTDVMTNKSYDKILDAEVHGGFGSIARVLFTDIKNNRRINPRYRVTLTGHSLGGAIALLVALYLNYDPNPPAYDVIGVYTFGQPKVLDNTGVSAWSSTFGEKVVRVVDCDDPVPIVPTDESWFGNFVKISLFSSYRLTDFQHIGTSVILFDNGQYWMTDQVDLERGLYKSAENLIANEIHNKPIDHSMSQYQIRLAWIPTDASTVMTNPPTPTNFPCSGVARQAGGSRALLPFRWALASR